MHELPHFHPFLPKARTIKWGCTAVLFMTGGQPKSNSADFLTLILILSVKLNLILIFLFLVPTWRSQVISCPSLTMTSPLMTDRFTGAKPGVQNSRAATRSCWAPANDMPSVLQATKSAAISGAILPTSSRPRFLAPPWVPTKSASLADMPESSHHHQCGLSVPLSIIVDYTN